MYLSTRDVFEIIYFYCLTKALLECLWPFVENACYAFAPKFCAQMLELAIPLSDNFQVKYYASGK